MSVETLSNENEKVLPILPVNHVPEDVKNTMQAYIARAEAMVGTISNLPYPPGMVKTAVRSNMNSHAEHARRDLREILNNERMQLELARIVAEAQDTPEKRLSAAFSMEHLPSYEIFARIAVSETPSDPYDIELARRALRILRSQESEEVKILGHTPVPQVKVVAMKQDRQLQNYAVAAVRMDGIRIDGKRRH